MKCDGIRAETRFRLSAKRTSPIKSAGGTSVQSITGSRGVRISGSNARYTMFRGSVKGTGYPLHSPVSSLTSPPARHRVPSHFNWSLVSCKDAVSRGQLKFDGTRAETRLRLSAKRTSPFKSAEGRKFSRLLAAKVCASAVVMLDTPCSEVVRRVLAIHCIRQFPLHFPSRASPCAITFQLQSSKLTTFRENLTVSFRGVKQPKIRKIDFRPKRR